MRTLQLYRLSSILILALLVVPLGVLRANPKSGKSDSPPKEALFDLSLEELMKVSIFDVDPTDNVGYLASQSITGTRISTDRKSLPFPITVLTEDLLEDIAAHNIEDAVPYIGSVNKRFGERDGEVLTIRGFGATRTPRLRNGLIVKGYTDAVNWQRVEVIKGSPSVLYGQTFPSGIVNAITERPSFEQELRFSRTIGSYGLDRAEFEATGPLKPFNNLAFRLAGSYTEHDTEEKHEHLKKEFIAPSLTWRIFENLTLNLAYEYLDREWTPSQGPALRRDANGFLRHDKNLGGGHGESEWRGPNDYFNNDHAIFTAFLDWEINDHFSYRFSFADSEYNRDVYSRNPGFLFTVPTNGQIALTAATLDPGEPASHIGHIPIPTRRTIEKTRAEQMRHDLQMDIEFLDAHHSFVLSYDRYRVNDGENSGDNAYDWRITPPWDPNNPKNNNPDGSVGWPKMPEDSPEFDLDVDFVEKGFDAWSLIGVHTALDERLNLTWGLRYDELVNPEIEETSYMVGAYYQLFEGFGLFANSGTSFLDNGRGRNNEVLSPEQGQSTEGGIKFTLQNGRINGSLSYFNVERMDIKHTVGVFDALGNKIGERTIVSGEEESKGFDLELTIQPIDNWSTLISASVFNSEVLSNEAQRNEVGLTPQFAAEEMGGIFTRYDFTSGPLQNWSVGLGANYRGEVRLGNAVNKNWTQKAESRLLIDAMLRYRFDINEQPASFTLNVTNLTDEEYIDRWQGWGNPRWVSLTFNCSL